MICTAPGAIVFIQRLDGFDPEVTPDDPATKQEAKGWAAEYFAIGEGMVEEMMMGGKI